MNEPILKKNDSKLEKVWLKRWNVFARHGTLIDDLSFSFYFHSTVSNQFLHFFTIMLIYICIAIALAFIYSPYNVPIFSILFYIAYSAVFFALEPRIASLFVVWFAIAIVIASQLYNIIEYLYISLIGIASEIDSGFIIF